MSHDAERRHIDFTKDEVTRALTDYARKQGADLPDDLSGVSFHMLGSNHKREGYYARLSIQSS